MADMAEAMEVCDVNEFQGKTAKLRKQSFAAQLRTPRFWQTPFRKMVLSSEILDDEVVPSAPKVQLMASEFFPQRC